MDLFQSLLNHGPRTGRLRIYSAFPNDSTSMLAFPTAVMHQAVPTIDPHRHRFGAGTFAIFILFKVVTIYYSCMADLMNHLRVQLSSASVTGDFVWSRHLTHGETS